MANFFKFGFLQKETAPTDADAEEFLSNMPMLLILGSLESDSRKDVIAYARGLAESQVIAKEACFIDAVKRNGRWLYEIHEGGPGRSVAQWVTSMLESNPRSKVSLPLTGARFASISEVGGELVTVIYPPSEEKHQAAMEEARGIEFGPALAPFYGSGIPLRNAAAGLLALSAFIFLVSGAALFLRGNAIDVGRFAARFSAVNPSMRTDYSNLPSVQLAIAVNNIKVNSGYLSYLKYENGKWHSAQTTANTTKPAPIEEEK